MKTVIEMAQESGFQVDRGALLRIYLEDFAELVRADAIAEEREACAKVCDDIFRHWLQTDPDEQFATPDADDCARAIRERSANAGARGEASIRSNT